MTESEIIEGAKLIARFVNHEPVAYSGNGDFIESEYCNDNDGEATYYDWDKMKFHKSWDWLMPIIRKAKDYLNNMERPSKNHCCKGDLIEVDLQCRLWEIDIEKTWKHTVELITWINEYEKTK